MKNVEVKWGNVNVPNKGMKKIKNVEVKWENDNMIMWDI